MIKPAKNQSTGDARSGAYEILQRVDEGGYADLLLDAWIGRHPDLDPRERGLLTELVYGVLRLRGQLDFALTPLCRQALNRLEPATLRLLRIGAYQLLALDRIPPHAAVHATVELAKRIGMERVSGLVNGVLRSLQRQQATLVWPTPADVGPYLQHVCSLPVWLAAALREQFGDAEALALGEALAAPAPHTVRVNSLRCDRETFLVALAAAGHEARPCRFAPEGVIIDKRGAAPLPGASEGWYQVQDEASMLIAHLLAATPGEQLLDACAAPGGKTTHVAALTANRCPILALDKHPQRVKLVESGAQRLGATSITARAWDLTVAPDFIAPGSLDRILVDAPCTGLGVLRRNPESRWTRTPEDVTELAALQQKILATVAPLLKIGGTLLYSVCTFTPAETDTVVATFLAAHPEFGIDDPRPDLPAHWAGLFAADGSLRTRPQDHDGMDAFFAVRLRRRGAGG